MQVEGIGPGVADRKVAGLVEVQVKYAGYLRRQAGEIERNKRNENKSIPRDFNYPLVPGLSSEVSEKLQQMKPETVGQASRIPGVTPAAISLLLIHLKKQAKSRQIV